MLRFRHRSPERGEYVQSVNDKDDAVCKVGSVNWRIFGDRVDGLVEVSACSSVKRIVAISRCFV